MASRSSVISRPSVGSAVGHPQRRVADRRADLEHAARPASRARGRAAARRVRSTTERAGLRHGLRVRRRPAADRAGGDDRSQVVDDEQDAPSDVVEIYALYRLAQVRHTKIIATLGPAIERSATLDALHRRRRRRRAAELLARHARSHHAARSSASATPAARAGRHVAVLQDLSGPKIRTGRLKAARPLPLADGERW